MPRCIGENPGYSSVNRIGITTEVPTGTPSTRGALNFHRSRTVVRARSSRSG
jgi:hypothetical protein